MNKTIISFGIGKLLNPIWKLLTVTVLYYELNDFTSNEHFNTITNFFFSFSLSVNMSYFLVKLLFSVVFVFINSIVVAIFNVLHNLRQSINLLFGPWISKICLQFATIHKFHYDKNWFFLNAATQQTDNIDVRLQCFHDLNEKLKSFCNE